mmetsp:Transcript_32459/g.66226  ORF Transcript_32459/g.66226 Transcript_32459/m.66226 type:complete len:326 (-) Transcript_32459:457-1434(-)
MLQVVLREVHVLLQRRKRDLWFDHPELGQVPVGVAVFRAERGAKRVHVRERAAVRLHVELPRHRQPRLSTEKVFRVVHVPNLPREPAFCCALFNAREVPFRVLGQQRGHGEHLPRALAVRARDQGGVHVQEPARVEERVRRVGHCVAQPLRGGVGFGSRPQVRQGAQVLEGVALLGQRVLGASHREPAVFRFPFPREHGSEHDHFGRLHLHRLLPPQTRHHDALHAEARARPAALGGLRSLKPWAVAAHHALQVVRCGAVVEDHEKELALVGGAHRAGPAFHHHKSPQLHRCLGRRCSCAALAAAALDAVHDVFDARAFPAELER